MLRLEARSRDGKVAPLALGALLGKGGEGEVFHDALRPERVIKLFRAAAGADKAAKIRAMLTRPPAGQIEEHEGREIIQIAWPLESVHDASGALRGFSMRAVDFTSTAPLNALHARSARRRNALTEDYRFRLYAGRNLAALVGHLHAVGHHLVDTKPQNIRVYRDGAFCCLLDCDGYAVAGPDQRFPAVVRTAEFLAPEGFGKDPALLGEMQDRFGLAVMLFELLANGVHPCAGRDPGGRLPPDVAGRLERRLFFIADPAPFEPPWNSTFAYLPAGTREMFRAALCGAPDARPDAGEWTEHLASLLARLELCTVDPGHFHLGEGCPWCALADKRKARAEQARREPRMGLQDASDAAVAAFAPRAAAMRLGRPARTARFPAVPVPRPSALQRRSRRRRGRPARVALLSVSFGALLAAVLLLANPLRDAATLRLGFAQSGHGELLRGALPSGPGRPSTADLPPGLSIAGQPGAMIDRTQQALSALGYEPGKGFAPPGSRPSQTAILTRCDRCSRTTTKFGHMALRHCRASTPPSTPCAAPSRDIISRRASSRRKPSLPVTGRSSAAWSR